MAPLRLSGLVTLLLLSIASAAHATTTEVGAPLAAGVLLAEGDPAQLDPAADDTLRALEDRLRTVNPELAAARLDADAVAAAAAAAGALDDPQLSISLEDIDRDSIGLPRRVGTVFYAIDQKLPWFGKRSLQQAVAKAEAGASRQEVERVRFALIARLKEAYADLWLARQTLRLNQETEADLRQIAELAAERYGLGLVTQGDVAEAEIAVGEAAEDHARLQAMATASQARLNALIDRPADAEVVVPRTLDPPPAPERLTLPLLIDRAERANPEIAAARESVSAAGHGRQLAAAGWYPDFTVGFSVVERRFEKQDGYEFRVGMDLPLQWGVRRARVAEAAARLGAAEKRVRVVERQVETDLADALAELDAVGARSEILSRSRLPQAEAAVQAAQSGYSLSRNGLGDVIAARRRLRDLQIEKLGEEAAQRRILADIERLIGGDL